MTLALRSKREQDLVFEAMLAPEEAEWSVALTIAEQDFVERGRALSASWYQENATPIILDAGVGGEPAEELDGAKVLFFFEVENVLVPQLTAPKSEFVPAGYGQTGLLAATAGAYLNAEDAITLGTPAEYPSGTPPDRVGWDVARRLPYDLSRVRIGLPPGAPNPSVSWTGDKGFTAEEKTGAVLARLEAELGYQFRDTPYGGLDGYVPVPLGAGQEVLPARRFNSANIVDWSRPKRQSGRYHDVRVYRRLSDGTVAFEAVERVPYAGRGVEPLPGQTLNILLEDDTPEAPTNMRRRAALEALDRGRGLFTGAHTFPVFDPLIQAEDRYSVDERRETDDGIYVVRWLHKVDGYRGTIATGGGASLAAGIAPPAATGSTATMSTQASYTATILERDKLAVPTLIVPRRSPTVVKTPPES